MTNYTRIPQSVTFQVRKFQYGHSVSYWMAVDADDAPAPQYYGTGKFETEIKWVEIGSAQTNTPQNDALISAVAKINTNGFALPLSGIENIPAIFHPNQTETVIK